MSKFKRINLAEYVLDKCKSEAWKFLEEIDFNIRPTKPKLLSEELIKVNLQFHILGRNNKPDFVCELGGDNCFLFSLSGEMLKKPDKNRIISKIEEIKGEYHKAF